MSNLLYLQGSTELFSLAELSSFEASCKLNVECGDFLISTLVILKDIHLMSPCETRGGENVCFPACDL